MGKSNQLTIQAYNEEIDTYIKVTPSVYQPSHAPMLSWIASALNGLAKDCVVLEIGSATPRDASYIRSKGYRVQTSDATISFVEYLNKNGENAILFNALEDPIPDGYTLFFANAVVPHFTSEDTTNFLQKMFASLPEGGRVAFNVKIGQGDDWINEKLSHKRYIHYWQPDEIKNVILNTGFKIRFFDENIAGDLPNHRWVNIVIEKPATS